MKIFYTFLLVAFSASISQAQIVDIPDPAFKAKLLSYNPPIDTNADGEIQVSEASAVTQLSFYQCNFDNMTGIQSFTNLEHLGIGSYCNIASTLDLTGMSSLEYLNITKSGVPAINLSGLTGLKTLSEGYEGDITLLNFSDAVNLEEVYLYNAGMTSIDLSPFSNLVTFSAQNVPLTSINVDGLSNLISFKFKTNGDGLAGGLDISGLTSLKFFECEGANLNAIDFSNNLQLQEITTWVNNFSTFDVSMLPNLTKLFCMSSHLTSLDLSNNANLETLICGYNELTSIDLSNLHKLNYVALSSNLFTTLDFSSFTDVDSEMPTYDIKDNPNLVSINLKNGKHDYIPMDYLNCPNLVYLCLDDVDMEDETYIMQQNAITNIQINTYCSFVPGGNYNTITGTISMDLDNNGCDANDLKFQDAKLNLSAAGGNGLTFTNNQGNYNFYTQSGDFVVTPEFENPYFTISPPSATVNFADSDNHTQTQNFCITPNGVHNDVEITLIPVQSARPGFDALYRLAYKNKGNQVLSGSIDLTFDDAVLDFVSANPNTASQSVNQLHWDYSNLSPFEKRSIDFTLNVNSPQETPAVNNGDILNFSASITPATNDETIADNTAAFSQIVLGSFDPNDKICLEGATILPQMVGDYLHYVIRFQNSGTFLAENVVITDLIDTNKFDISTLQLTASSHPQVTRITGDKAEFIFENINLPAEQDDEPGSHGYIAFKIKTKPTLALNAVVQNTAYIFFDFNFPIATNTASTSISQLGLGEVENQSVSIAPNPVRNILNISAKETISSIQLFDIQGRLLQTKLNNENTGTIDFTGKTSGVYFVKVYTDKGMRVQKVIKE
jgi:hypothetical protein